MANSIQSRTASRNDCLCPRLVLVGALAIGQQLVFWTVIRKLDQCPEEDLTPPGGIHS
jgi:hypothetical protein